MYGDILNHNTEINVKNGGSVLYQNLFYYMLYDRLLKYNGKLYSEKFTVELSEHNFPYPNYI